MQLHRLPFADYVDVTFNIGFCSLPVWKLVWDKPLPKYLNETDCCPRTRIGYLISSEKNRFIDKWWSLQAPDETMFAEIRDVISAKCVPFYERMQSLLDLRAVGETLFPSYVVGEQIQHAVLCYLVGDAARCQTILEARERCRMRTKYWDDVVAQVRARLKILFGVTPVRVRVPPRLLTYDESRSSEKSPTLHKHSIEERTQVGTSKKPE